MGFLLLYALQNARKVRQIQEKTVLSNCVRLCSVCSACIRCAAGCHQSQKKPKLVVDKQRIRCYHIQAVCVTCKKNMGVFPSGQWGQTVNLLLSASVVRIHPRPPKKLNVLRCVELFVYPPAFSNAGGWIRTAAATSLKTVQKQPSGQRRQPPPKGGNREEPLGLRSAGRPCRPRHEADAWNRNPGSLPLCGWARSTRAHQELQRLRDAGVSILSKTLQSAPKGRFGLRRRTSPG